MTLRGMSEIRAYLRTNTTPVYFVSPTPFNLLGLDRWMRDLYYLTYYDSFEGTHGRVFVPRDRPYHEFTSIEDVCNYLLQHKEAMDFVAAKGPGLAVFVMFDEETERLCSDIGLRVAHPSASLRKHLDSKIVTTRLGNEAGVPSVPNVLGQATTYDELVTLAATAGLGEDLVVQSPYGDSGKTTFFIRGEQDWAAHAAALAGDELKVMRRIRPREVCVEACITRHGVLVGPFVDSMVGLPELTPYQGGWCGNEIYPGVLTAAQRGTAVDMTKRLGDRLSQEGYRGFFELDYLVDEDTGDLYLGEINPRVSGLSPITHVTLASYADMPLFLFHVLEYLDVDYEIDVEELNERWAQLAADDEWSQLIIKEPGSDVELFTETPRTGIWYMGDNGSIRYGRWGADWHGLVDEEEGFYLRVSSPGDYRYTGADLGVLVARGRMQTEDGELTDRCRRWIAGLRAGFSGMPLEPETSPIEHGPFAFKAPLERSVT